MSKRGLIISRPIKDNCPHMPNLSKASKQPEPRAVKSLSGLGAFHISTPRGSEDVEIQDLSDHAGEEDLPRKRAAIGDSISAGSGSPYRESCPPPRRSKARNVPGLQESPDQRQGCMLDIQNRPQSTKRQLWSPDQQPPLTKASFTDKSNIASVQFQRARQLALRQNGQKSVQRPKTASFRTPPLGSSQTQSLLENYDIILQPETRPISQEQLVAEVKGIYAGLIIVEAKCIEVDNEQATLAQADPGAQPKLNNEQWQALIALYGTLLDEHHDFFLASQHPSASPALRSLASKYSMPIGIGRYSINSCLEFRRHRVQASLDHILPFRYLAYPMKALLPKIVPTHEDTRGKYLVDLGRYRMATEEGEIRKAFGRGVDRLLDRTASDKSTSGRPHRHQAILPRPKTIHQPVNYTKALRIGLSSTPTDSILRSFNPVRESTKIRGKPLHCNHEKPNQRRNTLPLTMVHGLTNVWSKIIQLCKQNRSFLTVLALMSQVKSVASSPANISPTSADSSSATMILPAILILAFFAIVYADRKLWKGSHLVLISAIIVAVACFTMGSDNDVPHWQLYSVWLLGSALEVVVLKDKLSKYPQTRGSTALSILSLGIVSSIAMAHYFPIKEGRYSDPFKLVAVASLPSTVFVTTIWITIFDTFKIADNLERGTYDAPILVFFKELFVNMINWIPGFEGYGTNTNRSRRNRGRRTRRRQPRIAPEVPLPRFRSPRPYGSAPEGYQQERLLPNNWEMVPI